MMAQWWVDRMTEEGYMTPGTLGGQKGDPLSAQNLSAQMEKHKPEIKPSDTTFVKTSEGRYAVVTQDEAVLGEVWRIKQHSYTYWRWTGWGVGNYSIGATTREQARQELIKNVNKPKPVRFSFELFFRDTGGSSRTDLRHYPDGRGMSLAEVENEIAFISDILQCWTHFIVKQVEG